MILSRGDGELESLLIFHAQELMGDSPCLSEFLTSLSFLKPTVRLKRCSSGSVPLCSITAPESK
jgi:hypothetical protein